MNCKKIVKEVDKQIAPKLAEIEDQIVYNQAKVLYKHFKIIVRKKLI